MSSHDAERAYVQSMLDVAEDRFDETIAAMQTNIDRLRDEWAGSYAEQRQAHEGRLAAMQAETKAWIKGLHADDEGAPKDVQQAPPQGASPGRGPVTPAGVVPGGLPNLDPREIELERALAIKAMTMGEYAERRAELGVRSATSMSHLFGETR